MIWVVNEARATVERDPGRFERRFYYWRILTRLIENDRNVLGVIY